MNLGKEFGRNDLGVVKEVYGYEGDKISLLSV
jgi:hypothetical protein